MNTYTGTGQFHQTRGGGEREREGERGREGGREGREWREGRKGRGKD